MRRLFSLLLAGPLLAGLALGCQDAGDGRGLGIDATGAVAGFAYLDRNGNGRPDGIDGPVPDLDVALVLSGARDTVARATTDDAGVYVLGGVAVGSYRVVVDTTTLPDTLEVVSIDTAEVTVAADDTSGVLINLSYPHVAVSEARALPPGQRVALNAVALNRLAAFGDATLHLDDGTGAIRAVASASGGAPTAGDSVRLVGTTGTLDGQPALRDAVVFVIGAAATPQPDTLATAVAATADGGALDAALARVERGAVLDVRSTIAGDKLLIVDDGSGSLEVVLDRNAGFASAPLPGAISDVTGVLVPSTETAGRWMLKPRSTADLYYEYPQATVAEARDLPQGKRVAIEGSALNGWATFGDATVHLADATGSIRAIQVSAANVFAGDSVRLLGTVSVKDGQPVLANVIASVLAIGTPRTPRRVATADAASAAGGLDAALVKVVGAVIADTATSGGDFWLLGVDDGSGPVDVVLDKDTGIQRAPYVPGVSIDAAGVLVPRAGGGAWVLKPRSGADLSNH